MRECADGCATSGSASAPLRRASWFAFSWFHVNLLGIGLHAYGFASSTKTALYIYYLVQIILIVVGSGR
jgi:hypothetical protein